MVWDRYAVGQGRVLTETSERSLYPSVLERVKTDHGDHAANSQHARQELEQRLELGADDFIVKPFKEEEVLAIVQKVLGE